MIDIRQHSAAIALAALLLFVGFGVGLIVASDFNIDRNSYRGGVSYIVSRIDALSLGQVDVDTMEACTRYVDSGMNSIDGYPSAADFLAGCRDAYADRQRPLYQRVQYP
jgi:hypothetical protein